MNFEEIQSKLEELDSDLRFMDKQSALKQFDELYKDAAKSPDLAEKLQSTMEHMKKYNGYDEKKGLKATLTPDQIAELEERVDRIKEAIQKDKELRDNSEKDKIDSYVEGKVNENKKEKAQIEIKNRALKDKKNGLSDLYNKEYKAVKEQERIANQIAEKLREIEYFNQQNGGSPLEQKQRKEKVKKYGNEVKALINEPSVKGKLGNVSALTGEAKNWNNLTGIADAIQNKAKDSKEKVEKEFNKRFLEVPDRFKNTEIDYFFRDNASKSVDEKWKILSGKIKENDNRSKAIQKENDSYFEYAAAVKEKAELDERQALSPEEFEQYAKDNEDLDAKVEANGDVRTISQQVQSMNDRLLALREEDISEISTSAVAQDKRARYLINHPKKLAKAVQSAQEYYDENVGGDAEITATDIINNTDLVQDLEYKHKNKYNFRTKIPIIKNIYKKRYVNRLQEDYEEKVENLTNELKGKKLTARQQLVQDLKVQQENRTNELAAKMMSFQQSRYESNTKDEER